jgi:ribosomal protein S18 acetylase RimI-like enzyme
VVLIRPATRDDWPTVDALIRHTAAEASPLPVEDYPDDLLARTDPADVLVAATDDRVVGFVKLGRPTSMATNAHVLTIAGLAVAAEQQGAGIGRRLALAAIQEATVRGARRLTLHVLGSNRRARDLYSSLGFVVEGVLAEEFLLGGEYVDDVLMALPLT